MRYKVYQSHANNGTKGKFYLRPVYDETVELDQLADHMASHNTPFSKGQLLAVLTDFVGCIKELCMDSKTVRIDGLGIFEARVRSKGAKTLKEFTLSENILSVYVAAEAWTSFAAAASKSTPSTIWPRSWRLSRYRRRIPRIRFCHN